MQSRAATSCRAAASSGLVCLMTVKLAWRSYEEYVPLKKRRQMEEAQRLARLNKVHLVEPCNLPVYRSHRSVPMRKVLLSL